MQRVGEEEEESVGRWEDYEEVEEVEEVEEEEEWVEVGQWKM